MISKKEEDKEDEEKAKIRQRQAVIKESFIHNESSLHNHEFSSPA